MTLEDHAASRGMVIIGLEQPIDDESHDFVYWYDGHSAIQLFFDCSDQWREGFGGISSLDMNVVLGLLPFYEPKKSKQLDLYRNVRAFVAGVLKHIHEQREKADKK